MKPVKNSFMIEKFKKKKHMEELSKEFQDVLDSL